MPLEQEIPTQVPREQGHSMQRPLGPCGLACSGFYLCSCLLVETETPSCPDSALQHELIALAGSYTALSAVSPCACLW